MDPQAFELLMKRFDDVDEGIKEVQAVTEKQSKRIRTLESWRDRQKGAIGVWGFVVTAISGVAAWFGDYIGKH